jgi:hypothetical protein
MSLIFENGTNNAKKEYVWVRWLDSPRGYGADKGKRI